MVEWRVKQRFEDLLCPHQRSNSGNFPFCSHFAHCLLTLQMLNKAPNFQAFWWLLVWITKNLQKYSISPGFSIGLCQSPNITYQPVSIITNSCTHSSIFIKNTLKVHVKFTPTCFGSQMEPSSEVQQLILAKVYKWFEGVSPYSQYCGGIRKPMCVYC